MRCGSVVLWLGSLSDVLWSIPSYLSTAPWNHPKVLGNSKELTHTSAKTDGGENPLWGLRWALRTGITRLDCLQEKLPKPSLEFEVWGMSFKSLHSRPTVNFWMSCVAQLTTGRRQTELLMAVSMRYLTPEKNMKTFGNVSIFRHLKAVKGNRSESWCIDPFSFKYLLLCVASRFLFF